MSMKKKTEPTRVSNIVLQLIVPKLRSVVNASLHAAVAIAARALCRLGICAAK